MKMPKTVEFESFSWAALRKNIVYLIAGLIRKLFPTRLVRRRITFEDCDFDLVNIALKAKTRNRHNCHKWPAYLKTFGSRFTFQSETLLTHAKVTSSMTDGDIGCITSQNALGSDLEPMPNS